MRRRARRDPVSALGASVLETAEELGRIVTVLTYGLIGLVMPPWRIRSIFHQMEFVGVQSLGIVVLTGGFTGAVFAIQAHYGFEIFGAETITGSTVALALAKELGPSLTALMVTGRAGSAMAAELGTMRVTEQIDALEAMAVDPYEYLVSPRIIACVVMVPVLAAVFTAVGLLGCTLVSLNQLGIAEGPYYYRISIYLDPEDYLLGLAKSAVFGLILGVVGCTKGLYTRGGAEGVGMATTRAVVVSSVAVLVVDYFLTDWWMV